MTCKFSSSLPFIHILLYGSHSFSFVTVCELSKFGSRFPWSWGLVTLSHSWDEHVFLVSATFWWIHFGPWLDSNITLTKGIMPRMMGYSPSGIQQSWIHPPKLSRFSWMPHFATVRPTLNLARFMVSESTFAEFHSLQKWLQPKSKEIIFILFLIS